MIDDQNNWLATAKTLITKAFLNGLHDQFNLGEIDPRVRAEFIQSAALYFRDLVAFEGDEIQSTKREQYKRLKKETIRFRDVLASDDFEDLETDLYWAPLHKNGASENSDIPEIPNLHVGSGKTYLLELERLLSLLENTADIGIKRFAPNRGPKPKYALQNLVRRLAFIWVNLLERPFTVDYHKGTGLTDAFVFVSAFVAKIDNTYNDTQVITAMRTTIKERGL